MNYPLYYYLILANIGVYAAYKLGFISTKFAMKHLALSSYSIKRGNFQTIITYSFTHLQFFHLGIINFLLLLIKSL